jgi:hypothetical protein
MLRNSRAPRGYRDMASQQQSSSRAPSVTNSSGDLLWARPATPLFYFTNPHPSAYINPSTSSTQAFVPGISTHSTLPANSPSILPRIYPSLYTSPYPPLRSPLTIPQVNTSLSMTNRHPRPTDPRERATEDRLGRALCSSAFCATSTACKTPRTWSATSSARGAC